MSEILSAVRISMVVCWVVTPCDMWQGTNFSEEHTASVFSPEDKGSMFLQLHDARRQNPENHNRQLLTDCTNVCIAHVSWTEKTERQLGIPEVAN
jgi:hypothetical protein